MFLALGVCTCACMLENAQVWLGRSTHVCLHVFVGTCVWGNGIDEVSLL